MIFKKFLKSVKSGWRSMELPSKSEWVGIARCLISEFLGTFLLVFIGCGSIIYPETQPEANRPNLTSIVFTFGFAVACLAQALGPVSCHINPAVTISMMAVRKLPLLNGLLYVPVQCLGSALAIFMLDVLLPNLGGNYGVTLVHPEMTWIQGTVIEFILTFTLLLVIFSATESSRSDVGGTAPLYIGISVMAVVFMGGPFTGASINPARSFGPALISGIWTQHWVYWIGPIGGGVTAAFVYKFLFAHLTSREVMADNNKMGIRELEEKKCDGATPTTIQL